MRSTGDDFANDSLGRRLLDAITLLSTRDICTHQQAQKFRKKVRNAVAKAGDRDNDPPKTFNATSMYQGDS